MANTAFYTGLRNTAAALLTSKGQTLTLVRQTTGAYDPDTGTAAVTESSETFTGAVFAVNTRDIDGTLIKAGDKRVIMSIEGQTLVPTTTDTLTIDSEKHRVIDSSPIKPAGSDLTVAHKLVVRRV